jgi:hypothetical protein
MESPSARSAAMASTGVRAGRGIGPCGMEMSLTAAHSSQIPPELLLLV